MPTDTELQNKLSHLKVTIDHLATTNASRLQVMV